MDINNEAVEEGIIRKIELPKKLEALNELIPKMQEELNKKETFWPGRIPLSVLLECLKDQQGQIEQEQIDIVSEPGYTLRKIADDVEVFKMAMELATDRMGVGTGTEECLVPLETRNP